MMDKIVAALLDGLTAYLIACGAVCNAIVLAGLLLHGGEWGLFRWAPNS